MDERARANDVCGYDVRGRESEAFVYACGEDGRVHVVQALLGLTGDQRVDVHLHNEDAFMQACRHGRSGVVRVLLGLGGDRRINVHARNDEAFILACAHGHPAVVRTLLSLRGDRYITAHMNQVFYDACYQMCSCASWRRPGYYTEYDTVVRDLLRVSTDRAPSHTMQQVCLDDMEMCVLITAQDWAMDNAAWRRSRPELGVLCPELVQHTIEFRRVTLSTHRKAALAIRAQR